ncbi:hypothetical protein LPJ70_004001, partial [Coemansia sp. RSA 2708]
PSAPCRSASTQTLLRQSPLYMDECDLYPGRLRQVVNRDVPASFVDRELRQHIDSYTRSRSQSTASAASLAELEFHPGALRELQLLSLPQQAE